MARRFYLDTSIWMDYFGARGDGIRPLGDLAFMFLKDCEKHKCKVLYSDIVLRELIGIPKARLEEAFSSFRGTILKVAFSEAQAKEAERISRERQLPFNDVFHAIIARDNTALVVTRDWHFRELTDIVESMAPEEITLD
ncbi:MAG: PIN domain-containing protein [Candidatus Diapherotrites archaeon]|nr:PIN domain-containing protein [Candidatus Micrarchaeota archaeon]MBU1939857.1 PIN domain-containing protein [Candidatus Micrarchaeota archaeon]